MDPPNLFPKPENNTTENCRPISSDKNYWKNINQTQRKYQKDHSLRQS